MRSFLLSAGVVVSVVLSSVSLGYQLKGGARNGAATFAKYAALPARESELDHRLELADVQMIRESLPMRNGIGYPRVWGMSADNSRVVIRMHVSEQDLPSNHDQLQKALIGAAYDAIIGVSIQFGKDELSSKDITVEFQSIERMLHEKDTIYAVFSNEELTFH